jgi:hypothetical protein
VDAAGDPAHHRGGVARVRAHLQHAPAGLYPHYPARTATTALFQDPNHLGERGYGLIVEAYRRHLT